MKTYPSRRRFLQEIGKGAIMGAIGPSLASELGMLPALRADEGKPGLHFGDLEPLVAFMQETPLEDLQSSIVAKISKGASVERLVSAGALANARSFAGEDYIGFHTLMAMKPALKMASLISGKSSPLPVLKVLYRNTNRIQEHGGREKEKLNHIPEAMLKGSGNQLLDFVRSRDIGGAERLLKGLVQKDRDMAFNALLEVVQEDTEVHRTVLPYRAWDMVDLVGEEHATTLLRQSLRYCLNAEHYRRPEWSIHGEVLTKLLDEHRLLEKEPGTVELDDEHVKALSQSIFEGSPKNAAGSVAEALAQGVDPKCIGEALSMAANQIVLRDPGRPAKWESTGKPPGSVHGDSVGVHSSDATNAWRNLSRVSQGRNIYTCLILGAWQVARDRGSRPELVREDPLPVAYHLNVFRKITDQTQLLNSLKEMIQGNLQGHATAVVARYAELGFAEGPVFQTLLRYAVSEDGALHAEKYFETVRSDFYNTRPAFRWNHLLGLARITASEFGRPAAGQLEARALLQA
jgi:hypothetical protein